MSAQTSSPGRDATSGRLPLWTLDDAVKAAAMMAGYVVAPLVPRTADVRVSRWLAALWLRLRPHKLKAVAADMRACLPEERDWHREAADYYRMLVENGWGRIRAMHGRGHLLPKVAIDGLEHIRGGLSEGRGVILWRLAFCSGPALMYAFHREGLPLVHLSRVDHGSTNLSRLGLGTVCRWWQMAENPHLEERVSMPLDQSLGYVRALLDRLKENRILSIAGEHAGAQSVTVRLLGRPRSFGQGAPSLAWITGARLLPVYMLREAPYSYRIVVEEPIPLRRELGKSAAVRLSVEEFARKIERTVKEKPADYRGWGNRSLL